MLSDTTRSDLEQLLAEQDNGWCAYRDGLENTVVSFGIGGCLVEQMHRLLDRQGAYRSDEWRTRRDAMITALGFVLRGAPYARAMYEWNDRQRDPDVIKRRIKDALNGEYLHVK